MDENEKKECDDNLKPSIKTRIPELTEVFHLCKDKIKVNVELKGGKDDNLLVKKVIDLAFEF
jgi:glycerophosphoryl diester phosphodiesterase